MSKVDEGYDLIICDTYGYLVDGESKILFDTKEERDKHITDTQKRVKNELSKLKSGKETGNVLVGVNVFSFSSLGEDLFKKENAKRALVWNREKESGKEQYQDSRIYFMWGVVNRGWIFNLQEGENFFRGEFLEKEGKYETALDVVRDMVRRFTNDGGKVLEIDNGHKTVVQEAVELEGREYSVVRDVEYAKSK